MRNVVRKHRTAAFYGGMAGLALVLILCAWGVYGIVATPAKPNVQIASGAEIVRFVADRRGLAKLPKIEQIQFLRKWKVLLMPDAARKKELAECFETTDERTRKAFAKAVLRQMKRDFMDDARQYSQIRGTDQAYALLRKKQDEYRDNALFMKEVGHAFRSGFDTRPEKVQEWLIQHTTPEERAIGEPYVEALKKVRIQIHKEMRATAPHPDNASADAPS